MSFRITREDVAECGRRGYDPCYLHALSISGNTQDYANQLDELLDSRGEVVRFINRELGVGDSLVFEDGSIVVFEASKSHATWHTAAEARELA